MNSSQPNVGEAFKQLQTCQGLISTAEWGLLAGGVPSTKFACQHFLGWGGLPRRPVPESPDDVKARIIEGMQPLAELEGSLHV